MARVGRSYVPTIPRRRRATAAVVPVGTLADLRIQEDTGTLLVPTASAFVGDELTFSLISPPAGATIDGSTGVASIATGTIGRRLNTTITVRASNVAGSADQTFKITVGSQKGAAVPTGDLSGMTTGQRTTLFNGLRDAGYTWVRMDMNRELTEPSEGVHSWALTDDLYNRATAAGLKVLWILLATPAWTGQAWNALPSNLTKYQNWIGAVMARYPAVKTYEIWNEQNGNFASPSNDGAAYENVLTVAYDKIKATDPAATVIFGGLTASDAADGSGAENFLTAALAAGAGSKFDAFAIHPYYWTVYPGKTYVSTDNWMGSEVERDCRSILVSNALSAKKTWITETGGPTQGTNGGADTPLSQANQAAILLDVWDQTPVAETHLGPIFDYTWADRGGASDVTENWYGIVGTPSGGFVPKLAYTVMSGIKRGQKPELVIDGACNTTGPGFRPNFGVSTVTVSGGLLRITNGAADFSGQDFIVPVVIGKTYRCAARIKAGTAGGTVSFNGTGTPVDFFGSGSGEEDFSTDIIATRNFITVFIGTNSNVNAQYTEFDNFSVKEFGSGDILVGTPVSSIIDNFPGSALGSAWANLGVPAAAVANNDVTLTLDANYDAGFYTTASTYCLEGSSISWRLAFTNKRSSMACFCYISPAGELATKRVIFQAEDNLYAGYRNGVSDTWVRSDTVYNAATHKYLRISESGGTISFEYSSDKTSWTTYTTMSVSTLGFPISGGLYVTFFGGDFNGVQGTAVVSEINTPIPTGQPGDWKLLFSDEFSGSGIDLTKWRPNWLGANDASITPPVNGSNDNAYDPARVSVSGGNCVLSTVANPITISSITYPYRSGMIQSFGKFTVTPESGKPIALEARINLQASSGTTIANFPAWWTAGDPIGGGTWPDHGEIDIVEGLSGTASGHFHYPGGGPGTGSPSGDNTGWRTWAAKVTYQDKIDYYRDGTLFGTITPRGSGYQLALSSPQYLILNLAVDAGIGGPDKVPGEMLIDYVRVWKAR